MKITCILVAVAVIIVADVATERICGTQPLRKKEWSYDNDKRDGDNRIAKGTDSYFGEWPWQALLVLFHREPIKYDPVCGGVLITSKHILTAAHCPTEPLWALRVVLGEHDLRDTKEPANTTMEITHVITHEKFTRALDLANVVRTLNDIQVLVMKSEVVFSQYIRPICFPKQNEDFNNKMAWVTGWGHTGSGGANVLKKVAVPIWDFARCEAWEKNVSSAYELYPGTKLCAGYDEEGKGHCHGDSGGPLVVQRPDGHWTLVGITSEGTLCLYPKEPNVYMRVTYYTKWIEKNIDVKLHFD